MEAYSKEFRRDMLREYYSGKGTLEVALKFKVSDSWVRGIKQQRRDSAKSLLQKLAINKPSGPGIRMRFVRPFPKIMIEPSTNFSIN